jgi:hypothetical protein
MMMGMSTRALVVALVLVAAPAVAVDRCGDADGNGAVTVTDGVQILRAAAGLASSCTLARCDLDDGGSISVTDGVNVLRDAAGLPVNLACPGETPTCTAATVTVALAVPEPIGAATLTLDYPQNLVTLPGSGDAAAARVTIRTSTSLLNDGSPNDHDDTVTFVLIASAGLDDGDLLSVRFDCLGAVPTPAQFGCAVSDATAPDGLTPVDGATCSVAVSSE